MVTEFMENYRNEEAGQSSLVLAKAQRLPWKKIMNLFNKNKAIKKYVVNSVPNSSASKKISFCLPYYVKTRVCRSKPVGITRAKGLRFYFAIDYVYVFKTMRSKKDISSINCLS